MEDIECSISECSASLHDELLFTTARNSLQCFYVVKKYSLYSLPRFYIEFCRTSSSSLLHGTNSRTYSLQCLFVVNLLGR